MRRGQYGEFVAVIDAVAAGRFAIAPREQSFLIFEQPLNALSELCLIHAASPVFANT